MALRLFLPRDDRLVRLACWQAGAVDEVQVRGAEAGDWPSMWAFMAPIVAAGDTFSWAPDRPEDAVRASWFPPPPGGTLVAELAGRVVGTAEFAPNHGGPAAHVANASYMVDPASSGRGVGRALVQRSLAAMGEAGFRAVQFNAVVETNERAVALYLALGFTIVGTVPEAYDHPRAGLVGLHVMHRRL